MTAVKTRRSCVNLRLRLVASEYCMEQALQKSDHTDAKKNYDGDTALL